MASPRVLAVKNLGRMAYKPAIKTMKDYEKRKLDFTKEKICEQPIDTLFLVEHNPVYTIGNRMADYLGQSNNSGTDQPESTEQRLRALGAEFHVSNRGGLITYHGPGQLVCYPVINLKNYTASVRWYINSLEDVIINSCAEFGVKVGRTNDIGVWIENRKIAAIGMWYGIAASTH